MCAHSLVSTSSFYATQAFNSWIVALEEFRRVTNSFNLSPHSLDSSRSLSKPTTWDSTSFTCTFQELLNLVYVLSLPRIANISWASRKHEKMPSQLNWEGSCLAKKKRKSKAKKLTPTKIEKKLTTISSREWDFCSTSWERSSILDKSHATQESCRVESLILILTLWIYVSPSLTWVIEVLVPEGVKEPSFKNIWPLLVPRKVEELPPSKVQPSPMSRSHS